MSSSCCAVKRLSRHAAHRAQGRGFDPCVVEATIAYGKQTSGGSGRTIHTLRPADERRARASFPELPEFDRRPVVITRRDVIITVMWAEDQSGHGSIRRNRL